MIRRRFLTAALTALCLTTAAARAATEAPFDARAFAAAQQAGKPVLVEIWASWCPICAKQTPILSSLTADPAFKDLMMFKVDFDSQKDVVRDLGASRQSTLIVFHGAKEAGRSVGDTHADSIRALVEQANK
jgi:thioredoxin 1